MLPDSAPAIAATAQPTPADPRGLSRFASVLAGALALTMRQASSSRMIRSVFRWVALPLTSGILLLTACSAPGAANTAAGETANATNQVEAAAASENGPAGGSQSPAPLAQLDPSPGAATFCDCTNIDAGLLTREYQKQCGARDAVLRAMTVDCGANQSCISQRLKLTENADHKLVKGEFCDGVAYGPAAWPMENGPSSPPPRPPPGRNCTTVSGLSRNCTQPGG